MALKIRLRQQGRKNRAFYRLVLADARAPRDGKYLESLGWYDPIESDHAKGVSLKKDRLQYWLGVGAQLTDNAESLVKAHAPEVHQELVEKRTSHLAKMAQKRKKQSA